jgi:hypothetical protein
MAAGAPERGCPAGSVAHRLPPSVPQALRDPADVARLVGERAIVGNPHWAGALDVPVGLRSGARSGVRCLAVLGLRLQPFLGSHAVLHPPEPNIVPQRLLLSPSRPRGGGRTERWRRNSEPVKAHPGGSGRRYSSTANASLLATGLQAYQPGGAVALHGYQHSGRPRPRLAQAGEAVAYIGGGPNRPVSRRLICLGTLPEVLRTAHLTAHLRAR